MPPLDRSRCDSPRRQPDSGTFWGWRRLIHLPPVLRALATWSAPSRLALLIDLVKVPTKILESYVDITDELGDYARVVRDRKSEGYTVTLIGPDVFGFWERLQEPTGQWDQYHEFRTLHIWSLVRCTAAWVKKGKHSDELMAHHDTVLHDGAQRMIERPSHVYDQHRYSRHMVTENNVVVHEYYLTWWTWLTPETPPQA